MSADENDPRHLDVTRSLLARTEEMYHEGRARNARLVTDNDQLRADLAAARAALDTVQAIVADLEESVRNRRASMGPAKGMTAPYHGPFCSAVPSVLKDLDRYAKSLREALAMRR